MRIGGYEFLEYTSAERRGPVTRMSRDSGDIERLYRLVGQAGARTTVTPEMVFNAGADVLGYSVMRTKLVTVGGRTNYRRWIERFPPHFIDPGGAGDHTDGNKPNWLYAHAVEECLPPTGHVTASAYASDAPLPDSRDGYAMRVRYRNFPYRHLYDSEALAADVSEGDPAAVKNPLAAGFTAGGNAIVGDPGAGGAVAARPDEGDRLRRGWLDYGRYVVKRVKDRTRQITLPGGLVKFSVSVPDGVILADSAMTGLPFMQPRADVTYHWIQVPVDAVPLNAIDLNRQRTNRYMFDGYVAGTLLFSGFDYEGPYQTGYGSRWYVDVIYKFEYMPNYDAVSDQWRGWNSFPRVINGVFRYWEFSTSPIGVPLTTGQYVYPLTGNFPSLFRPDQIGQDLSTATADGEAGGPPGHY